MARVTLLWFVGLSAVLAILIPSGSDAYSAGAWDHFLLTTFRNLTPAQVDAIVVAVRKSIHFFGYGTLALIWAAALAGTALLRQSADVRRGGHPTERGPAPLRDGLILHKPALTLEAGLIAFFVAAADEWNQTRFAERTGSVQDVVLDVAGIVAFLTLRHWLLTRPNRRRRLNRRTQQGA